MKKRIATIAASLSAVLASATQTLTLAWDHPAETNANAFQIYTWTNTPDALCAASNAVQIIRVGDVTNATLEELHSGSYTFAATTLDTNTGAESVFSSFAYYTFPSPPSYLVTVQTSTNLTTWTNTNLYFRLKIEPQ